MTIGIWPDIMELILAIPPDTLELIIVILSDILESYIRYVFVLIFSENALVTISLPNGRKFYLLCGSSLPAARAATHTEYIPCPPAPGGRVAMVLPKLISEVLRQRNPRAVNNNKQQNRSESPWQGSRQRSTSTKRKSDDSATQGNPTITFANITAGHHTKTQSMDDSTEANIRSLLTKAKENSKAMRNCFQDIQNQESCVAFFETLFETIEMLTTSQEALLDALKNTNGQNTQAENLQAKPQTPANDDMVCLGSFSKKQCFDPALNRFSAPHANPQLQSDINRFNQQQQQQPVETEQEKS